MSRRNRIIFAASRQAKLSSDRGRAPRFLRMAPVNSGEQVAELGPSRRSSPLHLPGSATGSGPVPIVSRIDRPPGRHARSPSEDCRCGHESKTDDRPADRAAIPPVPAVISWQSLSSYRCDQSPARRELRSETGSWPFQHRDNPRQRRRIDVSVDDHATPAPQHNLDPTWHRSRASCRRRVLRTSKAFRRWRQIARQSLAADNRRRKRRSLIGLDKAPLSG